MSLFATQLLRHSSLRAIPRDVMWAKHPAREGPSGHKYVPAVHTDPRDGPSIFINAMNKRGYEDRVLPDGRTIEYHASVSPAVNRELRRLVDSEVTLYAQLGRHDCRVGRVVVEKPRGAADEVFHLRLVAPAGDRGAPASPPPPELVFPEPGSGPAVKINWADM